MPTYGYRCKQCQTTFERLQAITDPPIETCPKCGGSTNRVFYPVGIIFKGSGFHVTDYPKADRKKASDNGDKAQGNGEEPAGNGQRAESNEPKKETKASKDPD